MRKLLAAAFALVAALAFFVVGSPSASAFGSEVLGCDAGLGWTANSCSDLGSLSYNTPIEIDFSVHNTSGSYSTSWTVTGPAGSITQSCNAFLSNKPCISRGCTASWLACSIYTSVGFHDKTFTASVTLIQSGQARTLSAQAFIWEAA